MKEKIDFKYNLKVYYSFLRKYKLIAFSIIVILFITELANTTDRYLFKLIIDKGTLFSSGELSRSIFMIFSLKLILAFLIITLIKSFFKWYRLDMTNKLDANMILDLKKKFFTHLINLSHGFHTSHKTGSLISKMIRGGNAIDTLTDAFVFSFFPLIFSVLVVGSALYYFDPYLTVTVFLTMVIFLIYSIYILVKQRKFNIVANNKEDIEKATISNIFTNIDSVKYFGKEKQVINKFSNVIKDTKKAFLVYWKYFNWLESIQAIILGVGTLTLVWLTMSSFIEGELSLGSLVFIYTTFTSLFHPLSMFISGLRGSYRAMADFDALFRYSRITNEIKDKPNAKNLRIKEGEVEFKDITFKYNQRILFENFNLKIPKNTKVALVGHSGCGKTTLIKLLYRFYNLNKGKILIDGRDIADFKQESLRSELSIVPQECVLFDDTVRNNILFSKPKATEKDLEDAIKFAQLDKTIEEFPKKEKTIVGERGVKLSGGEKQRVSIARAILANKKILILDEATSSLDSQTESEIQKDLEKLMHGRTSIIIAHRLSTIMKADKIVVLSKGEIVQIGTHNELINQPGLYKKLWHLQKGGYIK